MAKGTNFREPMHKPWDSVFESVTEAVMIFISTASGRYRLDKTVFDPWLASFSKILEDKIRRCSSKYPQYSAGSVLGSKVNKEYIAKLHNRFIIAPADKASNNFVFICKKYCLSILLDELGFDLSSYKAVGNPTYVPVSAAIPSIVSEHCRELKELFNIRVKDEHRILPKLFWIPKLHKNPYKSRFIAGARLCTTKSLAVTVNKGLQLVRDKFVKKTVSGEPLPE